MIINSVEFYNFLKNNKRYENSEIQDTLIEYKQLTTPEIHQDLLEHIHCLLELDRRNVFIAFYGNDLVDWPNDDQNEKAERWKLELYHASIRFINQDEAYMIDSIIENDLPNHLTISV